MSDKIVNVYVGECFQDGGQAGGEGKTYGLTLSGNKLKLVENGQQSEVVLPTTGGGVDNNNNFFKLLAQTQFNLNSCFYSWNDDLVAVVITNSDPGATQYIHIFGDTIRPSIDKTGLNVTNFIDKDGGALGQTEYSRRTQLRGENYEIVWEGVVLGETPLTTNVLDISKVRVGINYMKLEIRYKE